MSVDSVSNLKTPKEVRLKEQRVKSVVPWSSAAQFKKVYDYLYCADIKKKKWAVDQMTVWETNCYPSLPMAIEASLVISRAIIQDILLTNNASLCQERDIQMLYSMALVRFVNLTIEPHLNYQTRTTGAQIAKGLGIPSWIVDLRNEATHSFWPSIPSLRMAAESAMKYLSESYWEKEYSTLKNSEKEISDETEIRRLLHSYIHIQFEIMNKREGNLPPEQCKREETLSSVIDKLSIFMKKDKHQFIIQLVSDGVFIPFDEELKKIMSEDEYMDYEEVYNESSSENTGIPTIPPVPAELEVLWKKMMIVMINLELIPLFLEALLKSQAERTEMGKKLIVSWIARILRMLSFGDCFEESYLKKIFNKRPIVVDWNRLFHAAVAYPCFYTPSIFPLIFSHLHLKKHTTQYILNLMAITLGQADWKALKLPRYYTVQTVDNLRQMLNLQKAKTEGKAKGSDEELFFYHPDDSFESTCIGHVANSLDDDDEKDEQFEPYDDIQPIHFIEKDTSEKCFLSNENDIDEEGFVVQFLPDISEDEIELSSRFCSLYKKKKEYVL